MTALHIPGLKRFSEAIERIHQQTDLALFPAAVFEAIEFLVPDVVISFDEFNLKTGGARTATNRPPKPGDSWPQRLRELVPVEHPAFPVVRAGGRNALQISDFLTEREFRRLALYHDVFRPLSVRHQIVLPLFMPDHVAGITIARWKKFRAGEVTVAQLLAPHISMAHVRAQRLESLSGIQGSAMPGFPFRPVQGLTAREAEVLHWVVQGKRDSEIATILGASVRTIHKHVQRVLEKFRVETRTAAALHAVAMGIAAAPGQGEG